jgi:plastocyanin
VPRFGRILVVVALLALAAPAGAAAAERTLTFTTPVIKLERFGVARATIGIRAPGVDGYIRGMTADVVDLDGHVLANRTVMLHHVVFVNVLHHDYTCKRSIDQFGNPSAIAVERFWAESEEHVPLALPEGYGYPIAARDAWALSYMLMNHQDRGRRVQVRYTVRVATGERLAPVRPVWLDVRNCQGDPMFSVPGTGKPGSIYAQRSDFKMPRSGWLVAGNGHLHGGGIVDELSIVGSRCVKGVAFASVPTWGGVRPTPIMHEPGPSSMTRLTRPLPVRAGETLRMRTVYDDSFPHVRVMGVMFMYFAPGPVSCPKPLPPQSFVTRRPPHTRLLLLKEPSGPLRTVHSTWVGDDAFGAQRVSIRRGTTFTWRFVGTTQHDATLASGPVGFASRSLLRGTYRVRFKRKGVYRLFCSLHPAQMTEEIVVR